MATKTRKPRLSMKPDSNGVLPLSDGDIMTLAEAASFLRVSEDGLKVDAANGKVPARLIVGEWRFSRDKLLDWLGHCETKSRPYSKERILALSGVWKDDPTVDAMVEEIYRQRKANTVGGT